MLFTSINTVHANTVTRAGEEAYEQYLREFVGFNGLSVSTRFHRFPDAARDDETKRAHSELATQLVNKVRTCYLSAHDTSTCLWNHGAKMSLTDHKLHALHLYRA